MNQADKDAAKWMESNAKWQQRRLVEAKERGFTHFINQYGDVVTVNEEKKDANAI
jgi:hypothetical protein